MKRKIWFLVFVPLLGSVAILHLLCLQITWAGELGMCLVALIAPLLAIISYGRSPRWAVWAKRHLTAACLACIALAVYCSTLSCIPIPSQRYSSYHDEFVVMIGSVFLIIEVVAAYIAFLAARLIRVSHSA